MIRGYNCLYASFNATLKKGAQIKSQSVTCGDTTLNSDGYFEYVHNNVFVFTLTDTRDITVTKTVTMPVIDYIPVTCDVSYETELRGDNTANITITLSGNYFNGSFGKESNTISLQYRCGKDAIADDQEWQVANPNISDGGYMASFVIENADYKDIYVVQAWVNDRIVGDLYAKEQRIAIMPVFDWGKDNFNFNVPVFIEGKIARTYDSPTIFRAFTQEVDIEYDAYDYIDLRRNDSPNDLVSGVVADNYNGTFTMGWDTAVLINVHIVSSNPNGRSWIRLMNCGVGWKYTDCINYGSYTTSNISIMLKLKKGDTFGVQTLEPITINSSGLIGSYIEIMQL
jgi:hypothetical protein